MSLPQQLYKLQQLDNEIAGKRELANEISHQLNDVDALVTAKSKLASQKQKLAKAKKEQKSAEWELEDLQDKSERLRNKLYNGTVKNPKELINLEHEVKTLKSETRRKEDELLELMSQVEEMQAGVKASAEEIEQLKQEWQRKEEMLNKEKTEVEAELDSLSKNRQELAQQISSEALSLYERIKLTRGQAVAKVEQGRCHGCRITLPTSQWQKAKVGDFVQCNSCSRILYLE